MKKRIIFLFSVIAVIFPFHSFTQNFLKPEYVEGNFNAGSILKNHPQFPPVEQPSFVGGIHICSKFDGAKPWHKNYNYAEFGFNVIFGNIGNKNVLGNVAAVIPEILFPHRLSEKFKLTVSVGIGISYFNKPYNQVSNPENIVIGSHLTFCAMAAVSLEYKVKDNFSVMLRPCLYHSSNSHTSLPNVGMNLPLIGIGIKYFLRDPASIIKSDSSGGYDKNIHFNMRLGLGVNEQGGSTGPANGPKYPIYIASFFVTKNISLVNKLQMGIEGWYNTGVYDYITSEGFYDANEHLKSGALVFFIGHEFLLGHFSLVTQGGIYIYNPFYRDKLKSQSETSVMEKFKTLIPARLGYQYYFFDATVKHRHNLFLGIYIKTNLGQADFLDMGAGYTF
ncbi:MAG: acyloxyacyl hydrolase [Bacteroidia bacterium]